MAFVCEQLPLDPELEKYRKEYPDSEIVAIKIHLDECDEGEEGCEEGSLTTPGNLTTSGPVVDGTGAQKLWTKDDEKCTDDGTDADCNKSEVHFFTQRDAIHSTDMLCNKPWAILDDSAIRMLMVAFAGNSAM